MEVTGQPVTLMRPPYGATDKRVGKVAKALIHPTTVNAVPAILHGLTKRGFTFVTVPEPLAASSAQAWARLL